MTKKKDESSEMLDQAPECGLKEAIPEECPPCPPGDPSEKVEPCPPCDPEEFFDRVVLLSTSDDMLKKVLAARLHKRLENMCEQKLIDELERRDVDLSHLQLSKCKRPF